MTDNPDHKDPEEVLVAGMRTKKIKALEKLYDMYAAMLFGVIVRNIKNEERSEAYLLKTFIKAWQQAPDFNSKNTSILRWLIDINQKLIFHKSNVSDSNVNTSIPDNIQEIKENAIQPRAKLRDKLLHKIASIEMQKVAKAAKTPPIYLSPELHFNHKKRDKYKWLLSVCFTLFVLSSILSFYFYQRWKRTKNQLADSQTEHIHLNDNVNKAQQKIAQLQTAVVVLEDDQMKRVKLKGQAKSPDSEGVVHYNPKKHQIFLELKLLPLPPVGFQYQLWALSKSGKPVNAGLVDPATSLEGMQQMKPISRGRTFLLTLEPKGGSAQPNLDQLYLMGKI